MEADSQASDKQKSNLKRVPSPKSGQMKKLSNESAKLLSSLRERANKKSFGRKVKESEILELSLKLVTVDHLKDLQDQTYSAQDRLKMRFEDYQRANGKISFDTYISKLMNGELESPSSIKSKTSKELNGNMGATYV